MFNEIVSNNMNIKEDDVITILRNNKSNQEFIEFLNFLLYNISIDDINSSQDDIRDDFIFRKKLQEKLQDLIGE